MEHDYNIVVKVYFFGAYQYCCTLTIQFLNLQSGSYLTLFLWERLQKRGCMMVASAPVIHDSASNKKIY